MKDEIITARVRAFRKDDLTSRQALRARLDEACEIIEGLVYQLGQARAQLIEAQNLCKVYEQVAKEQRIEAAAKAAEGR